MALYYSITPYATNIFGIYLNCTFLASQNSLQEPWTMTLSDSVHHSMIAQKFWLALSKRSSRHEAKTAPVRSAYVRCQQQDASRTEPLNALHFYITVRSTVSYTPLSASLCKQPTFRNVVCSSGKSSTSVARTDGHSVTQHISPRQSLAAKDNLTLNLCAIVQPATVLYGLARLNATEPTIQPLPFLLIPIIFTCYWTTNLEIQHLMTHFENLLKFQKNTLTKILRGSKKKNKQIKVAAHANDIGDRQSWTP